MLTLRLLVYLSSVYHLISTKAAYLRTGAFLKRTVLPGSLGFGSVYIVWITWSHLFSWDAWVSQAYTYGDHLVLPLFNAIAFVLLFHRKGPIPIYAILVVVPIGLLVALFEPSAAYFRQAAYIDRWISGYHIGFIFLQLSFIVFVFAVYPFLGRTAYAPLRLTTVLFLLLVGFLGLVFVADDHINNFPLWKKILTVGLLAANYGVLVLDRKFNLIERTKGKLITSLRRSREATPAQEGKNKEPFSRRQSFND